VKGHEGADFLLDNTVNALPRSTFEAPKTPYGSLLAVILRTDLSLCQQDLTKSFQECEARTAASWSWQPSQVLSSSAF